MILPCLYFLHLEKVLVLKSVHVFAYFDWFWYFSHIFVLDVLPIYAIIIAIFLQKEHGVAI